jgi:DNA polymerase II large subunit
LVLVFLVAAGFFYNSGKTKEQDLKQLREENTELPQLRAELKEVKKVAMEAAEATLTGKEREELIRLRNEVGQLRNEKQKLATQVQQVQQQNERQLQAQQAQQAQQLQQLQQQNQQLTQQTQQQQAVQSLNACINNLRQIDGAKQQWALENKQPANALVTPQHIAPYLKNQALPVCPSGGTYTLNDVQRHPTCSIPGHALPR